MKATWGLAAALLLAGCKLIDQTTFAPSPEAAPTVGQMAKVDARTALLTINYTEPNPSYQDVLALCRADCGDAGTRGAV